MAWATLFRKVATHVRYEPLIGLPRGVVFSRGTTTPKLDARADVLARGLFKPQKDAYGDVKVMDTGQDSYEHKEALDVLTSGERGKRDKYEERVQMYGDFVPLVCSVYGTLEPEAAKTLHSVARRTEPEESRVGATVFLQHALLQTAIIRATSFCLRERSRNELPAVPHLQGTLADPPAALADVGAHH